jgi:prepilin-type N-terminal cleavage/methylation domain-containing protein
MHTPSPRRRAGFTLVELLVVIAIMAMLAAILFPVFNKAREKGRQATCTSNQRQIVTAIIMYADDWETYPGVDWRGTVQGLDKKVLNCPSYSEKEAGIGMNGFLHGIRHDLVFNPSGLIATCDSYLTSTIEPDFARHSKGALNGRLDGSVAYANKAGVAGRFAAGKFPIMPTIVDEDGKTVLQSPPSFHEVSDGEQIITDFVICGPYGSDNQLSQATFTSDLLGTETEQARKLADVAPIPGTPAPAVDKILPADANAPHLDVSFSGSGDPRQIKTWTAPAAYELSAAENYNCTFFGRATYYATYVYSEQAQATNIDLWGDDKVKIWINGIYRSEWSEQDITAVGATATGTISVQLPAGISYLLIKVVNAASGDSASPGGMKFKMAFTGFSKPIFISNNLD